MAFRWCSIHDLAVLLFVASRLALGHVAAGVSASLVFLFSLFVLPRVLPRYSTVVPSCFYFTDTSLRTFPLPLYSFHSLLRLFGYSFCNVSFLLSPTKVFTHKSLHPKDSTIPIVLAVIEAKTHSGSLSHAR